jgi:hypothetical protein
MCFEWFDAFFMWLKQMFQEEMHPTNAETKMINGSNLDSQ